MFMKVMDGLNRACVRQACGVYDFPVAVQSQTEPCSLLSAPPCARVVAWRRLPLTVCMLHERRGLGVVAISNLVPLPWGFSV
jgi:hypothetical protein